MPSRPKQQHYVTRAYLEGFLDPGNKRLICYGRHKREAFQGQPGELARQRSYYSVREPDGTWNDSLEHEIERAVEAPGLDVIRTLASGNTRIDWAQRDALAMLMAMQRFRVPHLRQVLDAVHADLVQGFLLEYEQRERHQGPGQLWFSTVSPLAQPGDLEGPRTYVRKDELEEIQRSLQEDPGQFSRETLFSLAVSFAKVFRRMKWTVHYSNRAAQFITSDCPVLLRHEGGDVDGAGVLRKDTHIEFPLSRNSLVSMTHDFALMTHLNRLRENREVRRVLARVPEIRIEQAGEAEVREFNLNQARYCSRWAFCGHRNDGLVDILREPSKNVGHRIVREGDLIRLESLIGRP